MLMEFSTEANAHGGNGMCICKFDEGQELSWLEHTTDNREVDGSSPFWPTTSFHKRLTEDPSESLNLH